MRLVTVRTTAGHRAARVDGDELVLLDSPDVGALLRTGAGWRRVAEGDGTRIPAAGADLAPVIPSPEKIFCAGLNYRTHALEAGHEIPDYPTFFAKFSRALIGPNDPIVLPPNSEKMDYEGELCVVIGSGGRYLDEAQARDAIAGFTVLNDISARDWQARTKQWLQGKTFEASTPVGPALVTLDELADPDDLRLTCEVDGELVQDASTSDLVFSPAALAAYASQFITLAPGDLIATGTPGGVGAARKPPRFLASGQVVRTAIAGVGELVNRVVAAEGRGR